MANNIDIDLYGRPMNGRITRRGDTQQRLAKVTRLVVA